MIKVTIRTASQLKWIETNWPNHRYEGWILDWAEGASEPNEIQGWVYIDNCDDADAAQIALTLGVEVQYVENWND